MSHQSNNLIIHCMDFRFAKALKEFMEQENIMGDCDVVSMAGGAKSLVEPSTQAHKEVLSNQIELSHKLHNINKVYLVNHTDCGAYGGKAAFSSVEDELACHHDHLSKAAEFIASQYPQTQVIKVLAKISDSGEIEFDKLS